MNEIELTNSKNHVILPLVMNKFYLLLIGIFVVFLGAAYALYQHDSQYDFAAMIAANALMVILSFISYNMVAGSLKRNTTGGDALYRSKVTTTMMKFVVIIGAAVFYFVGLGAVVHKPTVFFFLAVYLAYHGTETVFLSQLAIKTNPKDKDSNPS